MSKNGLFFHKFIEFVLVDIFLPPASNMPSSEEQDALFAEFKANIDKHLDDTVRTLISMAPKAAVNEVDETILAIQDWKSQLGDSHVTTLIYIYIDELLNAVEKIDSGVNPILRNHLLTERCSAHADALTY